jgi:DNA-binding SARP family transcriptional activator
MGMPATRAKATLEFGVLGPLAVWRTSPAGPLTAPKLRALLLLLLVEDEPVPPGQLLDIFSHRGRTGGTPSTIHVSVHRLRRWLRQHGGHRLDLTTHGYTLDVDPLLVDAGQFRRRLAAADAAIDRCARIDLLSSALSLWRGRIGDDAPVAVQQRAAVRRLEALREDAVVRLAQASLEAGEPGLALPFLDDVARTVPFDERVQAHLALVLAASGRQADALATVATTRRLLADELGIEPGPQLREAQLRILHQRVLPVHRNG